MTNLSIRWGCTFQVYKWESLVWYNCVEFMRLWNSLCTSLRLFTDWGHLAGSSWVISSYTINKEVITLHGLWLIILRGQWHHSWWLYIWLLLLLIPVETCYLWTRLTWAHERQSWGWFSGFRVAHVNLARFLVMILLLVHGYLGCYLRSSCAICIYKLIFINSMAY